MSVTHGVQHIGLAVSNLDESAAFFTHLLGWQEVKRREDYPAIFVRDGYCRRGAGGNLACQFRAAGDRAGI
ncbi:hypothetical protein EV102420_15_00880 [Pseudescherichia vulneris NBRC 102420]|uniref:VOC domain-containing protein n=1 Tax=Pseudescherichia vulneris NBRC 102420 TaxID=1115515 RepID=A0A090V306_PSEVU|nr:VOC family protein [Pseudescherichia vulneris]GAL59191.1 hypothetical protein EV102420_15_00880 [Pseudescherichia vulneris NBRC 102420]STQ59386.1 Uncharacterised protein [Pseudescherichia vulneris]